MRARRALAAALRPCLVAVCVCAEPVLHALGLPHPEGLAVYAVQVLQTR